MGGRVHAGPWAGLAVAPTGRSFGSLPGAANQNPNLPSQFLLFVAHSTPRLCLGFSGCFGGQFPRAELPSHYVRVIGMGWSLPKMAPSQQWKEEPISQQCRGWGWRAGGSGPRPIVWC